MERYAFRAMGTDIELLVDAEEADRALAAAAAEFERLEELLSRFRETSELTRLNRSGSIDASPDLRRIVELALEARTRTNGRFDPTVHDAMLSAGYDRTFSEVVPDAPEHAGTAVPAGGDVRLVGSHITLEEGVRIDLGGIGKGYAAERAAELLATAGPCLVNAGGDIATRGGVWPVGVETGTEAITLELSGGALATSGRDRRTWRRAGRTLHHVIDPRTGVPAETDVLRVTVVASDAVAAEIAATSLFLVGAAQAAAEADAARWPAVIIDVNGDTMLAGGLG
jgi:FAD:protein FMN transferase